MRNDDLISRDALIMAIRDAHIISGTSKAMMLDIVMKAPTVGGWISVEDEMPKQHKSIFAPWYGTKTWSAAMWKEESETVIVAGRFPDGSKITTTGRLCDSEWETRISKTLNFVVTHWMPMPEPPREDVGR